MSSMAVEQVSDPVVAMEDGVQLRLHARRLRGPQTLVEVARRAGLNRDELSRFERGETTQVRFATIAKLLAVYDCTLDELFKVERDVPSEAAPLYATALAALADGALPAAAPQRRTVRRSAGLDVVAAAEESTFGSTAMQPAGRRRAAVGTAHR